LQSNMKSALRKSCLEKRRTLETKDLTEKILSLPEYKNASTVFIYISYRDEIPTQRLIEYALSEKRVLVPLCINSFGDMVAVEISSLDELHKGHFGISEPLSHIPYEGEIDFSLLPGVAFSKKGERIGYGKGYYDRFLKERKTFKVGLCHDELLFDTLPCDENDVKADMIITPEREIRI